MKIICLHNPNGHTAAENMESGALGNGVLKRSLTTNYS